MSLFVGDYGKKRVIIAISSKLELVDERESNEELHFNLQLKRISLIVKIYFVQKK